MSEALRRLKETPPPIRPRRKRQNDLATPHPIEPHDEALSRVRSDLQRYAGWLAKDRASVAVRASVRALDEALDAGNETSQVLLALHGEIERLPGGGVRTMLRQAMAELRTLLEARAR